MAVSRAIRSVLIVDDDEALVAACVRSLGHDRKVYTATNAAVARQIVVTLKPDAAIVDLRLRVDSGEDSGLDLIRDLKQLHEPVRIALVSGYLSVAVTMAAVRAGVEVVLAKPISHQEILRHLEDRTAPEPDLTETPSLEDVQWEHISRVMADSNGNVSEAARRLGVHRQTLQRWLIKKGPKPGR